MKYLRYVEPYDLEITFEPTENMQPEINDKNTYIVYVVVITITFLCILICCLKKCCKASENYCK